MKIHGGDFSLSFFTNIPYLYLKPQVMKFSQISLLALFTFALFISCSTDDGNAPLDDDIFVPDPEASFSCKLNGETISSGDLLTVGTSSLNNEVQTLSASGSQINPNETITIAVTIFTNNFDELKAGDTFSGAGPVLESHASGAIGINLSNGNEDGGDTQETMAAEVIITAIDREKEIFSGTFSFTARNEDTEKLFVVTDGVFENVEYD